jgi:hypothetical protein
MVSIRGISDIVGVQRHDDWTSYACHTAASFARAALAAGAFNVRDLRRRHQRTADGRCGRPRRGGYRDRRAAGSWASRPTYWRADAGRCAYGVGRRSQYRGRDAACGRRRHDPHQSPARRRGRRFAAGCYTGDHRERDGFPARRALRRRHFLCIPSGDGSWRQESSRAILCASWFAATGGRRFARGCLLHAAWGSPRGGLTAVQSPPGSPWCGRRSGWSQRGRAAVTRPLLDRFTSPRGPIKIAGPLLLNSRFLLHEPARIQRVPSPFLGAFSSSCGGIRGRFANRDAAQSNVEAWLSQRALACFSGWSSRAVHDQADGLERISFIRVCTERRAASIQVRPRSARDARRAAGLDGRRASRAPRLRSQGPAAHRGTRCRPDPSRSLGAGWRQGVTSSRVRPTFSAALLSHPCPTAPFIASTPVTNVGYEYESATRDLKVSGEADHGFPPGQGRRSLRESPGRDPPRRLPGGERPRRGARPDRGGRDASSL